MLTQRQHKNTKRPSLPSHQPTSSYGKGEDHIRTHEKKRKRKTQPSHLIFACYI